jgi:probable HAF family extracellular repeat protein
MVGLGDFPDGSFNSRAHGVSADGNVVAGNGVKAGPVNEAFRWTAESGLVGLGDLPGGSVGSQAWGISADGNVIVGESAMGTTILGPNIHAFRWTAASNSMTDLGTLNQNEGGGSIANAVSGDGSAVVGYSTWIPGNQAFRWTQSGDMIGLGDLEGGEFNSEAFAASFDGSVVVGQSTTGSGERQAFRWTQATGMVALGDLPGGLVQSSAKGVSGDGSIIVGSGNPTNSLRAMIWDEGNGMRNLRDVLVNDYGLGTVLTGWLLIEANAISTDGNYIVGLGVNPTGGTEGWLVSFAPPPTSLPGDFNGDQQIDAADYTVWRDNFGTNFDLSGNGDEEGNSANTVDQGDYILWKSRFGSQVGAGGATHIPEPATLLLFSIASLGILANRRR